MVHGVAPALFTRRDLRAKKENIRMEEIKTDFHVEGADRKYG
jgi:hypothetical protein